MFLNIFLSFHILCLFWFTFMGCRNVFILLLIGWPKYPEFYYLNFMEWNVVYSIPSGLWNTQISSFIPSLRHASLLRCMTKRSIDSGWTKIYRTTVHWILPFWTKDSRKAFQTEGNIPWLVLNKSSQTFSGNIKVVNLQDGIRKKYYFQYLLR